MTFSLAGHSSQSGAVGLAVSSASPAAAARCAFVRAGVGAALAQSYSDPRLGRALIDEMAFGAAAEEAVHRVVTQEPEMSYRQLAAVDMSGRAFAFTGSRALGRHGQRIGEHCVAVGNLLASDDVLDAMVETFEDAVGAELGDRLVGALRAGLEAGGEETPVRSAALLMADRVPWPSTDLRVDWHVAPVQALSELWEVWKPQTEDYIARALSPMAAPGFETSGRRRG